MKHQKMANGNFIKEQREYMFMIFLCIQTCVLEGVFGQGYSCPSKEKDVFLEILEGMYVE